MFMCQPIKHVTAVLIALPMKDVLNLEEIGRSASVTGDSSD